MRPPRIPIVTSCFVLLALVACSGPELLQFHRGAIERGELWRVVTGHFVHWSFEHLLWDVLALGVLGVLAERHGRGRMVGTVLLSAIAISAAVWVCLPDMLTYRGLSGIDSGLFGLVACTVLIRAWRDKRRDLFCLALVGILVFLAKTGVECVTGGTLFADHAAGGFVPVPLAHAVGFAMGSLVAVVGGSAFPTGLRLLQSPRVASVDPSRAACT